MRVLPDINTLVIRLVDDHPGHEYVAAELGPALEGQDTLLLFGYLPLRVQRTLEEMGFEPAEARRAVRSLLRCPTTVTTVTQRTVISAYGIRTEKDHDVHDCLYVAIARQADADRLVTTDRTLESLCTDEPFDCVNPVPESVLAEYR